MKEPLITLERPGGVKPRLPNDYKIIYSALGFAIYLLASIALVTQSKKPNFLLAGSVTVVALILLALLMQFSFRKVREKKTKLVRLFQMFEPGIIHSGPTTDGWVACGENWFGIATSPNTRYSVDCDQIDNIIWGGSFGFPKSLNPITTSLPRKLINNVSGFHWLLLLPKNPEVIPVVATFRKERDRDEWLTIAKNKVQGLPISVENLQSIPSESELRKKSGFSLLYWSTGLLVILVSTLLLGATTKYFPGFGASMLMVSNFITWPSTAANAYASTTTRFRRDLLLCLATNRNEPFGLTDIPISGENLYLLSNLNRTTFEVIPLDNITDVRLENWGYSWSNRDLLKLFDKTAPPLNLVVRLFLNREQDSEREIQVPREVAQSWFDTLKALITTNSPVNEPQIDTSPRTLES